MNTSILENELRCMVCGYNLRGLPLDGSCPECGGKIANSRQGDFLRFANPDWVKCIYKGACLISFAFLLFFGYFILGSLAFPALQIAGLDRDALVKLAPYVFFTIMMASIVMLLIGVFLITYQEPREYLLEDPATSRRIARTAIVAGALLFVFRYCFLPTYHPFIFGNLFNIAVAISMAMCMKHAQLLVQRIPDRRLSKLLQKWHKTLLVAGLSLSGALLMFGTISAFRTRLATVANFTAVVLICVYVFVAIVSVGLFVGVAAALKFVQPPPR